jgi:ATP/maltotriose-dependent transcriptional regulator MalT
MSRNEPPRGKGSTVRVRGRAAELAVLDELVASTARGLGSVVLVDGPAGIGKSLLLAQACARAAEAGVSVACTAAHELGDLAPLGCFVDLLGSSAPPMLEAGDLVIDRAAQDPRLALLGQLRDAIETRAREQPTMLAIDDLQWADELSVLALGTLARQLAGYPVSWLLARRGRPTAPVLERTIGRLVDDGATLIVLGPLDAASVEELVLDLAGRPAGPQLRDLVVGAGGNPFFVSQLVRAAAVDAVTDHDVELLHADAIPAAFRDVVQRQLAFLAPDVRELLDVASVFGRRFTIADVSAVLDQPASGLARPLADAMSEGILVEDAADLAFRHDLLRLVVYEALPTSLQHALHRDVAAALIASGGSAVDAAPHVALSARPGDQQAIRLLQDAAGAIAATTPLAAIDLYRQLLGLIPDPDPARIAAVLPLVALLGAAGLVDEALAVADAALVAPLDPLSTAILLATAAGAAALAMRHDAALHYVDRALAIADLPAELVLQCQLLRSAATTFSGDHDRGPRLCTAVIAEADAAAMPHVRADALALQSHIASEEGDLERSLALADEAISLEEALGPGPAMRSDPHLPRAVACFCLDRLDDARRVVARGQHQAEQRGASWQLFYEQTAALLALADGALEDADALASGACDLIDEFGMQNRRPEFLHLRAQIALRKGDFTRCGSLTAELQQLLERGAPFHALGADTVTGRLAHAEGRPELAWQHLQRAFDCIDNVMMHQFSDVPLAPELILVALDADEHDQAERAARCAEEFVRRNPGVASIAGVALHARALLSERVDDYSAAVAEYRRAPRPLWLAAGLEALALARARHGERDAAVADLDEAMRLFQSARAERDLRRIRSHLRDLGVRRRLREPPSTAAVGWDTLSPAEQAVAELVVEGLTNREIAERLFLSPHTVGTHLKHMFLKLDIHTRVELARLAPTAAF